MPMFRLNGGIPMMSLPSIWMRPSDGGMKPAVAPSKVVLPDPLGPISEKNSPDSISRVVGASACKAP